MRLKTRLLIFSGVLAMVYVASAQIVDDAYRVWRGPHVFRNTVVFENFTYAELSPTADNGTFVYCRDCTIGDPCTDSGSGAFAMRSDGAWVCTDGSGAAGAVNRIQSDAAGAGSTVRVVNPDGSTGPPVIASALNIYSSYTDTSNWAKVFMDSSGFVGTNSLGSGAGTPYEVYCATNIASGQICIGFWIGGVRQWYFDKTSADLVALGGNSIDNVGWIDIGNTTQANLDTESTDNGTIKYCSNCNPDATCTTGGSGAMAFRVNGAWTCELN